MKNNDTRVSRLVRNVLFFGLILLAGCTNPLQNPPEVVKADGDGQLVITIGSGMERTVFPRIDQFSKIVLSFERKDGTGTLSPVEVSLGETVISLSPGTWEVTALGYNNAEPPVAVARAVNILTRTGNEITGNTHFSLEPAGTGPGFLQYTITPPVGVGLDPGQSRIWIEKDGAVLATLNSEGFSAGEKLLSEAIAGGTVSLEPGRYTVDIVLDDNGSINTAVYREAAVILPGLITDIIFAPEAGDFLDPNARATLTAAAGVSFKKTADDSSHTLIGTPGGGEVNKTQALSVHNGTETVYFTMEKAANQTITIGGAAAGSVAKAETGTVDGSGASKTRAVITVNTAAIADAGGNLEFTLSLAESGKTPIVYAVTLTVARLTYLHVEAWPVKWVYMPGDSFDPSGMKLMGIYSDQQQKAVTEGYTAEGFDSAAAGDRFIQIKKYGVTAKVYSLSNSAINVNQPVADGFTLNVVSTMALDFEIGIAANHNRRTIGATTLFPPPSGYTVGPGRTVVLAPVKWYIPDNAVYEWKVDGITQSSNSEYLSFAYSSPGDHEVTVTAKINGSPVASVSTTVTCAAGATQRTATGGSNAQATKLFSVVAPGQFSSTSSRLGSFHGAGGFGGYSVFKFDHSVEKKGTGGEEIKIGGNAFGGWNEAGAIWVSQDENNNGDPDDTWYELKGSHTFASNTLRRYAVTFRDDYTWVDNRGNGGTYPRLQAYPNSTGPELTLSGTCLDTSVVSTGDVIWGYADVFDNGRVSLSNAVQADGTSVDLPFIDFLKIVTAVHYADPIFGERSTEAGTPTDRVMPNPEMMITGSGPSDGKYSYTFTNNSGYALTISFDGTEFTVPASGGTVAKTSTKASVYIDFYGGNVEMAKSTGTVTFTNAPTDLR
jgi:hypothetical protein